MIRGSRSEVRARLDRVRANAPAGPIEAAEPVEPGRGPVQFLDGEVPRVAVWQDADPDGHFVGHYYVPPEAGTYSDALALVAEVLDQRDKASALARRYAEALAEILRIVPGHPAGEIAAAALAPRD